ncbi:hypothetical protein PPACK8108_LOCUS14737 [Phakopsora pachyrhizi]|uniref:Uncharacterized protein n=1 Tax=Phakopsora pachyrhizi TaxID=170000 RepID=A0AAV0B534_PHAPC|nr:hypothetical protein PPACK8108_LOCUS14737 [Phakopsora pachyrhizi]
MNASDSVVFELLAARRLAERYSVDPVTGGHRKLHIRRLFDMLHICEMRRDVDRAKRIWSILIRCREVNFSQVWDLGLRLLHLPHPHSFKGSYDADIEIVDKYLGYLKACQNLSTQESSKILMEYLCVLVSVGRRTEALDEVELYLSVLPHSQHSGLHEFAGMIALSIPQPDTSLLELEEVSCEPQTVTVSISNSPYFMRAKAYFERAQVLDPSSLVSIGYLKLVG